MEPRVAVLLGHPPCHVAAHGCAHVLGEVVIQEVVGERELIAVAVIGADVGIGFGPSGEQVLGVLQAGGVLGGEVENGLEEGEVDQILVLDLLAGASLVENRLARAVGLPADLLHGNLAVGSGRAEANPGQLLLGEQYPRMDSRRRQGHGRDLLLKRGSPGRCERQGTEEQH